MNKINEQISYIEKSRDPLSAEVFIIDMEDYYFVYDVGNGKQYIDYINRLQKPVHVVLSHFHPDHINNLHQINYEIIYQSKNTSKYTKIDNYQTDNIKIFEFPSTHAKGCLVLKFEEYLFIGDALYPNNKDLYNVNFLKMQIDILKKLDVSYIVCSHKEPLLQSKEAIIKELESIYKKRNPKEPYLSI